MAIFTEEKELQGGALRRLNLNEELGKQESVYLYVGRFETRTSREYGDFVAMEGLIIDNDAKSLDKAIEKSEGVSFIPNTMLLNLIKDDTIVAGRVYRVMKAWDRGEKFSDGRQAKGYGYKVFEVNSDASTRNKLKVKFQAVLSGGEEEEEL